MTQYHWYSQKENPEISAPGLVCSIIQELLSTPDQDLASLISEPEVSSLCRDAKVTSSSTWGSQAWGRPESHRPDVPRAQSQWLLSLGPLKTHYSRLPPALATCVVQDKDLSGAVICRAALFLHSTCLPIRKKAPLPLARCILMSGCMAWQE